MLALFLQLGPSSSIAAARESVPFDYAWRFHLGDVSPATCPPNFFNSTPGVSCGGLQPASTAHDAVGCAQACCGLAGCTTWQFNPRADKSTLKSHCWIGRCDKPLRNVTKEPWVGGVHSGPPAPTPVAPELQPGYDDGAWPLVDAPHDYIVTQPFSNATGSKQTGYFPRSNAVYRKHFALPAAWGHGVGSRVWLRFEGVYKVAAVYLNGHAIREYGGSSSAYTDFIVRLDNETAALKWGGAANVLALHIDGSYGSEHWYAGAGLYRSVHLERVAPPADGGLAVHVAQHGLYAPALPTGGYDATVLPSITVVGPDADDLGGGGAAAAAVPSARSVVAVFDVYDAATAAAVGGSVSAPQTVAAGGTANLTSSVALPSAKLWSVQRPALYTVAATIKDAASGAVLDSVNATIGVRAIDWEVANGFHLNGQNIKLRGFCHHDDFTAVGMAMPDRVWLLRAQQSRGVGGNAWRMSHNNYRSSVYDILDATGTVVWDETRDLRATGLQALRGMVAAHRNHPSVASWSFCNEGGCNHANASVNEAFRAAAKALDPFRVVTGNGRQEFGHGTLSDVLDVQGMSHPSTEVISSVRAEVPGKPLIASECCSCRTQRGEDVYVDGAAEPAFNADCLQEQVNRSDALPYVAGSLIWTLGDYMGACAHSRRRRRRQRRRRLCVPARRAVLRVPLSASNTPPHPARPSPLRLLPCPPSRAQANPPRGAGRRSAAALAPWTLPGSPRRARAGSRPGGSTRSSRARRAWWGARGDRRCRRGTRCTSWRARSCWRRRRAETPRTTSTRTRPPRASILTASCSPARVCRARARARGWGGSSGASPAPPPPPPPPPAVGVTTSPPRRLTARAPSSRAPRGSARAPPPPSC